MQSVGSPLPRSWMQAQWVLQKQILAMARPLGIVGVLPAFQGNIPPQITYLYPTANVSTTNKDFTLDNTNGSCAWISGSDPLFGQVADEWMRTMIADWGTDHW
jgi:alpha-N-acetylglucosaminidase